MGTDLGTAISTDIDDPVGFFLESKEKFMHKLKGLAQILLLS